MFLPMPANTLDGECMPSIPFTPSKVFAGIGENMALGLGEGWSGEFDAVKKSVNGDMDFVGSYTPSIATAKANTASSTAAQNNTDALLTAILNKLDGMGV